MEMNIRQLTSEELPDSLALSEFAFQMEFTPEQRERRLATAKPEQIWGSFLGDQLAAKLHLLELQTWIQGKVYAMGGVAGVASWPEHRRGGLVSGLLDNALKVMKEKGQTVSFLHPFQFAFYRKFGWETYCEYKKYEIETELLPKLAPQPGRIERVDGQIELLNRIYDAYASRYNGTLVRDEEWWRDRVLAKKGTTAVYYDPSGQPTGYVYYHVKDKVCTVHELVSLHHGARLALWRFLGNHDSMITKLVVQAPAGDQLAFLLDNPRVKQEVVPYFMARIVDVQGFVERYPFQSGVEYVLALRVTDHQADWNDGYFKLEVDESGTATIVKLEEAPKGVPLLMTDIPTLSAMLMGYQRPRFLQEIGRVQAEDEAIEAWEQLIPVRQTYLPDFF
ncbi:GNAT family N-acetyltransferase [Paenibacillus silviterrae]|uniref:GNAT family N-acetyltransferase n=1 Tax=Paenibacillus silviterrae TaxID=3242194 RepID=UPI0025436484|nr:GNAT family N-acetyltransferase [Paenibacillus chinjuensis]